jgi:tRNA modification GTPase
VAPFSTTDTIVAIATPRGRGALGIVRLSGPDALRIAASLIDRGASLEPRRATFARIHASGGARDEVVVTWFPGPHSSTGDDCVEVTAHGSPVVLDAIVEATIAAGARRAGPGEFTLRGFVNGRIDLTQAEAIADLTAAVTPAQARAAFEQLEGSLGTAIARLSSGLLDLVASLEASLDFPEEGYHFADRGAMALTIRGARDEILGLLSRAAPGCLLREGATVVLTGRPNAGKSSLFNTLLRMERAIVSAAPGTTRDVLFEAFNLNGVPVTLVDTAGQREPTTEEEAEGVRRAVQAAGRADVELLVLDGSVPLSGEDRALLSRSHPHRLVVASKRDLQAAWSAAEVDAIPVSARTGAGVDLLITALGRALGAKPSDDTPPVTNARHVALLRTTGEALARAEELVAHAAAEELVLIELNSARASLEEVTGTRTPEDVLAHVFERFCIGK